MPLVVDVCLGSCDRHTQKEPSALDTANKHTRVVCLWNLGHRRNPNGSVVATLVVARYESFMRYHPRLLCCKCDKDGPSMPVKMCAEIPPAPQTPHPQGHPRARAESNFLSVNEPMPNAGSRNDIRERAGKSALQARNTSNASTGGVANCPSRLRSACDLRASSSI